MCFLYSIEVIILTNLFNLYITFFKIGSLAFGGGYATIPLIERFVVEENNWLSIMEFRDIVSISQMTPGPLSVNSATFVGQKVSGTIGAIIATIGVETPQFILLMILANLLFKKGKNFIALDWILTGIKTGIVSLIFITALELFKTCIIPNGINSLNIISAITFIIGIKLHTKKISLFKIIGLGASLGIVLNIII